MKLTLEKGYKFPNGVWFPPEERKRALRHKAWLDLVKLVTPWVAAAAEASGELVEEEAILMAATVVSNSTELRRILRAGPVEGGGEEHRGDDKLGPGLAKCGKGDDDGE